MAGHKTCNMLANYGHAWSSMVKHGEIEQNWRIQRSSILTNDSATTTTTTKQLLEPLEHYVLTA
jgi:hypothetical protein